MLPLVGAAVSAIAGGGAGGALGGALGSALGGGIGGDLLGKAAGGIIGDVLGGGEKGGAGGPSNLFDPLGLGLPSPLELLQQGPSAAEQLLNRESPLDLLLSSALGGGQGPQG